MKKDIEYLRHMNVEAQKAVARFTQQLPKDEELHSALYNISLFLDALTDYVTADEPETQAEVERLNERNQFLETALRNSTAASHDVTTHAVSLERENAAMREIVQWVAERNPATTEPSHGLHTVCYFCGGDSTWDDDRNAPAITHESDCVWVHARAILAEQ